MAAADYKLCDLCEGKAFYDVTITDPRYCATYDPTEKAEPIGLAVLCAECNKTHQCVVVDRAALAKATEVLGDNHE